MNQNLVGALRILIARNRRLMVQLQSEQIISKMGKKKGRSGWTAPEEFQRARSGRASGLVGQRNL